MYNHIAQSIGRAVQRIEHSLASLLGRHHYPPEAFCLAAINHVNPQPRTHQSPSFSVKDLIGDGILWAVPKHRRTIEKRLKRKYGVPEYFYKMLVPKTRLRVCNQCGHDHELGLMCPHCYDKVRQETELIQEKIQNELGLSPIEKDVIVLYDGEKNEQPAEFWQGKRIVEMEKPRPMWFGKNLLQKTTQPLATTKEVKPNDLG